MKIRAGRFFPVIICFLFFTAIVFFSCSEPDAEGAKDFIIKSATLVVTADEFAEELELKKAAYPYTIKSEPYEYNQLVLSLLRMLTEEVILLTAADAAGVRVSSEELNQAVDEFKKDYPEDSFQQILLKNAIPYPFWLHRFKKHMIMDRLIDQELRKKIQIAPEDIVQFYQACLLNKDKNKTSDTSVIREIKDEKELVERLRMQKTQEKYESWIQELTGQYPVQINNDLLKTFLIKTMTIEDAKDEN